MANKVAQAMNIVGDADRIDPIGLAAMTNHLQDVDRVGTNQGLVEGLPFHVHGPKLLSNHVGKLLVVMAQINGPVSKILKIKQKNL